MNLKTDRDAYQSSILTTCIDLIQAAWQLDDDEFEQLLHLPLGWLAARRIHEAREDLLDLDRVRRLLRFHEALRLLARPNSYHTYIRRRWRADSLLGERSILEAIISDEASMNVIERYFWSQ